MPILLGGRLCAKLMHLFPIQLLAVTLVQGNPCADVRAKIKSVIEPSCFGDH